MSTPLEQIQTEPDLLRAQLVEESPPTGRTTPPPQVLPSMLEVETTGTGKPPAGIDSVVPPGTPPRKFDPRLGEIIIPYTGTTPDTLVTYFAARLTARPVFYNSLKLRNYPPIKLEESFQLFSIHDYPIPKSHEGKLALRIIQDLEFRIYFAFEGDPQNGIPGHDEMTDPCLFAGNVYLTPQGQIATINYKSGDFRTSFASMAFALCVLANYPEKLAPVIEIQELTSSGGYVRSILVPRDLLLRLANPALVAIQPTATVTKIRSIPIPEEEALPAGASAEETLPADVSEKRRMDDEAKPVFPEFAGLLSSPWKIRAASSGRIPALRSRLPRHMSESEDDARTLAMDLDDDTGPLPTTEPAHGKKSKYTTKRPLIGGSGTKLCLTPELKSTAVMPLLPEIRPNPPGDCLLFKSLFNPANGFVGLPQPLAAAELSKPVAPKAPVGRQLFGAESSIGTISSLVPMAPAPTHSGIHHLYKPGEAACKDAPEALPSTYSPGR